MTMLSIDTSNNKEVRVGLMFHGETFQLVREVGKEKTQGVLPLIQELLAAHNLSVQDVQKIQVETGPGSFTGLRVGVSIANTLGLLLQIPINDNPIGKIVEPVYS